MRVQRNPAVKYKGRGDAPWSRLHYVVLEVFTEKDRVMFRAVSDRQGRPAAWEARYFTITDSAIPSNWVTRLDKDGRIQVGPEAWQEDGFWRRYADREPAAVATYKREKNVIFQTEPPTKPAFAMVNAVQLRHVQKPYIATLATLRGDGTPHTAPVWYRYMDGVFFVLTERSSKKARNIARDQRVELCIDDRARPPYHTVIVRGRASIEAYPSDDWRLALAVHYLGDENGRRYVETTPVSGDDEVLLRIEPEQIVGW